MKIGLGIGGVIFVVGVIALTVAVVRGWAAAQEVLNPPPKTAEADADAAAWPEEEDDDDPVPKAEVGEASLLVSRAFNIAAVRRAWSAEAQLACTGSGCPGGDPVPAKIEVKPGMAVKWDLQWRAGESEAWTEGLASDLIAGRPDAINDVKLRFARGDELAELGRPEHRVVEFLDPERERVGMWAVIAERNAKVVALRWLGSDETRWTLQLET